jgi:hypothetical protein
MEHEVAMVATALWADKPSVAGSIPPAAKVLSAQAALSLRTPSWRGPVALAETALREVTQALLWSRAMIPWAKVAMAAMVATPRGEHWLQVAESL